MSDRELKDIGISRSQIDFAVRGDVERDQFCSRRTIARAPATGGSSVHRLGATHYLADEGRDPDISAWPKKQGATS
jgi:hypothetical protein